MKKEKPTRQISFLIIIDSYFRVNWLLFLRQRVKKAEEPLKLRYNFISRCSKADYLYDRGMEIQTKSYHGSGNGQGDIWKIGDTFLIDLLRCSVYDYRKKSYPTFTQRSKGMGKAVIYKALHKGDVN